MKYILSIAGNFVTRRGISKLTVYININTGLIASTGPYRSNADMVFDDSILIFPGFIDGHDHFREDGSGEDDYKETFQTGGEAAINGGVTHACEMGNNKIPPIDDDSYDRKLLLTKKCRIPVTLYAMTGPNTRPLQRRKVPYKWCHAKTTGKNEIIFFPDRRSIEEAAERYPGEDPSHHCEDAQLLKEFVAERFHELRRPPEAEIKSIDWALHISENVIWKNEPDIRKKKCKICHCSVGDGIDRIIAARSRGMDVLFELAPQHFLCNTEMITDENRPRMQMNPPLRSRKDQERCLEALRDEEGAILATDHAPHLSDEGLSGWPHLDTYGLIAIELMQKHGFTPERIVEICSHTAGSWLKQFLGKEFGRGYGEIGLGNVASFTLLDMGTSTTVTKDMLSTKCGWSPFEGRTFGGRVYGTIVRGEIMKLMK